MWFALALLTAFFTSLKDVFGRIALNHKTPVLVVAWAWPFCSLPFLGVYLLKNGIPPIGPSFLPALITSTLILSIASILFFKAISLTDLSLSVPMLAFTPLFLLFSSPIIVGEFPGPTGFVGVMLIVIGAYVLNIRKQKNGYFAPLKSLLKNKGSRYMLCVSLMYSVGANADKIGVLNSSPVMWIFAVNGAVSVILGAYMLVKVGDAIRQIRANWLALFLMGLSTTIALLSQMYALQLAIVPYVIAIKRTSVIMTSLFGFFLFKEAGLRERLLGVIFMIAGVFVIAFYS